MDIWRGSLQTCGIRTRCLRILFSILTGCHNIWQVFTQYIFSTSIFKFNVLKNDGYKYFRFRAIHHKFGFTHVVTPDKAVKLVIVIWVLGLMVTLPWAVVFQIKHIEYEDDNFANTTISHLPFCREEWDSRFQEFLYFLVIHVFACFLLPLIIITLCNVVMWRNILKHENYESISSSQSSIIVNASGMSLREIQRQRKLRLLKLFTGLTFAFFIFWLPLYIIMARVKFSYTETFYGSKLEQQFISALIPLAQLLGTCNSCVNPVLYALLNQTFQESFKSICPWCTSNSTKCVSVATTNGKSTTAVVQTTPRFSIETTAV